MAKATYKALTAIDFDGERYEPGEPIDLDDKKDAPALLAVQAIEAAESKTKQQPAK